jgi:hypothetical protein
MLALLERCVIDAGGTYAFCDTDSMAIVATETGGLIPCAGGPYPGPSVKALSWNEVDAIVARFAALNPYDRATVPGSILKIEKENFERIDEERIDRGQPRQLHAYVISAKRYALFNLNPDGSVVIRKYSEHGLGHLLNPTDPDDESHNWIEKLWRCIVLKALGQPAETPAWLDRPAISRITASTPEIVSRLSHTIKSLPYARRVKPFNFLIAAHVARFGHPPEVDPKHFQLIAPYTPDASKWKKMAWTELYSGQTFGITTGLNSNPRLVRVKSYRDVFEEYQTHPEPKSAAADGAPCSRTTRGLLSRRPVCAASIVYIGKESNRLDDVEGELVHDWDEVREVYVDPRHDPWRTVIVPILERFPRAEVARAAGIRDEKHVTKLLSGRYDPSPKTRVRLIRFAADYARSQLGASAPADDIAACAAFLQAYPDARKADTNSKEPLYLHVRAVLQKMPLRKIANATGLSQRHIIRLRNGQKATTRIRLLLTRAAATFARAHVGPDAPADDLAACAAFLEIVNTRVTTSIRAQARKATGRSGRSANPEGTRNLAANGVACCGAQSSGAVAGVATET